MHMDNYEFQFIYLPQLLQEDNDVEALRNLASLSIELSLDHKSYNMDDMTIIHVMRRGIEDFLIIFPKSDNEVEAIYGLVVIYKDMIPLYFTLERGRSTNYMLCRVDVINNIHFILEQFIPISISAEIFKDKVFSYIADHQNILVNRYDGDDDLV